MVGDESVLARVLRGTRVEVEVEGNRIELWIEIDAAIVETQRCVELQSGAFPVCKAREHLRGGLRLAKRSEEALDQFRLRAPDVLRPEFHHVGDVSEDARSLQLPIQRKNGRPKPHRDPPRKSRRRQQQIPLEREAKLVNAGGRRRSVPRRAGGGEPHTPASRSRSSRANPRSKATWHPPRARRSHPQSPAAARPQGR